MHVLVREKVKNTMHRLDTFIFDLDHTLYDANTGVFQDLHKRMSHYVSKLLDVDRPTADNIRKNLYETYGTTLNGLMNEYDIDPNPFFDYVHDVDLNMVHKCADTAEMIENLPGRKLVYTNAPLEHAINILQHLEILDLFEAIFDLKAANLVPKPNVEPYEAFIQKYNITPETSVMFEDSAKNLVPAARVGFKTVWLSYDRQPEDQYADAIDMVHPRLKDFLNHYYTQVQT